MPQQIAMTPLAGIASGVEGGLNAVSQIENIRQQKQKTIMNNMAIQEEQAKQADMNKVTSKQLLFDNLQLGKNVRTNLEPFYGMFANPDGNITKKNTFEMMKFLESNPMAKTKMLEGRHADIQEEYNNSKLLMDEAKQSGNEKKMQQATQAFNMASQKLSGITQAMTDEKGNRAQLMAKYGGAAEKFYNGESTADEFMKTVQEQENAKQVAKDNQAIEKVKEIGHKISLAKKGKPSFRKGIKLEDEYGLDKANEIREKVRDSRIGKTYEEIYGDNAELMRGMKKNQSIFNNPFQGKHHSEKSLKLISDAHLGKSPNIETRHKLSIASKLNWLDPNYGCNKPEYWDKQRKSKNTKPNGLEKLSSVLLDDAFGIGTWQFVGDFKLIIKNEALNKRRCPDFKHKELNKLIEVFNEYDKKKGYGSVENYKRVTGEFYRLCGYDVIFFTQEQVKNTPNNMIEEVRCFVCS